MPPLSHSNFLTVLGNHCWRAPRLDGTPWYHNGKHHNGALSSYYRQRNVDELYHLHTTDNGFSHPAISIAFRFTKRDIFACLGTKVNMTASKLICVIHSHLSLSLFGIRPIYLIRGDALLTLPGFMWPNFCIGSELHVLQSKCIFTGWPLILLELCLLLSGLISFSSSILTYCISSRTLMECHQEQMPWSEGILQSIWWHLVRQCDSTLVCCQLFCERQWNMVMDGIKKKSPLHTFTTYAYRNIP